VAAAVELRPADHVAHLVGERADGHVGGEDRHGGRDRAASIAASRARSPSLIAAMSAASPVGTVRRDIDRLRELGYPVDATAAAS